MATQLAPLGIKDALQARLINTLCLCNKRNLFIEWCTYRYKESTVILTKMRRFRSTYIHDEYLS